MAIIKIIERLSTVTYFDFYIDNVLQATNKRNDVFVRPPGICDFKTSTGANVIQKQGVEFSDIIIEDINGVQNTPTTIIEVYNMLANIKFFDWMDPSGNGGPNTTATILRVGDGITLRCDAAYIAANFDSTGLGINERDGWAMRNGQNGTEDWRNRVGVGLGSIFPTMGATGGSKDAIVISHIHSTEANVKFVGIGGGEIGVALGSGAFFNISGVDSTGSTGSSGTDKNMPPYIVTLHIERVTDLVASGNGVNRFRNLLDTFTYTGNDGKVPVVDESQNRLVPSVFYNIKNLTELQDVAISTLVPLMAGKTLGVDIIGGLPKVILKDDVSSTPTLPNEIIFIDEPTQLGDDFTTPAGGSWRINGLINSNLYDYVSTVPAAADGYSRIDILIAKQVNTLELITGDEIEVIDGNIAIAPTLPANTLLVTTFVVIGGDVIVINPIFSTPYVTKQSKGSFYITTPGDLDNLPRSNKTKYILYADVESVKGLANLSSAPLDDLNYDNQKYTFKNVSSVPCKFLHDDAAGEIKFKFPLGIDFILPPGYTIEFDYNAPTNTLDLIGSAKMPIPFGVLECVAKGTQGGDANQDYSQLEPGDMVKGFKNVTTYWGEAMFTGGDPTDAANYLPIFESDITEIVL